MKLPIPWQARLAVRRILDAPARAANAKRLDALARNPSREPVVAFGGVLDGGGHIHGGAVKLLHLREGLSADEACFNILYLVSSAQPPFAADLVRHCKRAGIRFVWNQNGVAYPGWAGPESERHNGPMRQLREQADFVVYQSRFCRESAEEFLGPCRVPSATLVNPVHLDRFRPADEPIPSAPLRLLTLGTHGYAERVLSAIRCVRVLRDSGIAATLTIAGKLEWSGGAGDVAAEIAANQLGGQVRVLPPFSQEEAIRLYQEHHILLHPKYLDPCPTVVIEALACGLPVIGSASGGLPELVPPGTGVLTPAPVVWDRMITPSGEEQAAAVRDIAADLPAFSRAARAHAEEHFDAQKWTEQHRGIFRNLLP